MWKRCLFLVKNLFKNCSNTTAVSTIEPPIKTNNEADSRLQTSRPTIGPRTDSVNIIIPTKAEGVDLAPIVISIKPKPN